MDKLHTEINRRQYIRRTGKEPEPKHARFRCVLCVYVEKIPSLKLRCPSCDRILFSLSPRLSSSLRISEEAAAMWKKHLERDDSRIVGEESDAVVSVIRIISPMKAAADNCCHPSSQTCSRASCGARCTAPCAPTTLTHSTFSATSRCPSPRGSPVGRSR